MNTPTIRKDFIRNKFLQHMENQFFIQLLFTMGFEIQLRFATQRIVVSLEIFRRTLNGAHSATKRKTQNSRLETVIN